MYNTSNESIRTSPTPTTTEVSDGGNIRGASASMSSARNITIERKVGRLLEVDINDTFRGVLNYTEEICPFLISRKEECKNTDIYNGKDAAAIIDGDVNDKGERNTSLNKTEDEKKNESVINGMSYLFQDMDEMLYLEMGFREEETDMSEESEVSQDHEFDTKRNLDDYNTTERNHENKTPVGITHDDQTHSGVQGGSVMTTNHSFNNNGGVTTVVGSPPPLLGLLRHVYQADLVHATNGEHSSPSTSYTPKSLSKAVTQPLEHQCIVLYDDFLHKIGMIRDAYREVAEEIKELQKIGNDIHTTVSEAAHAAEPLMAAVATYTEELKELKEREEHIRAVMEEYHVSPEERHILQHGDINETFLSVLEKVKGIHSSCRGLLVTHLQQAVIEVMEDMYLLQMAATDRLAQYICGVMSTEVMVEDSPQLNPFLTRCVMLCADRLPQLERIFHEVSTIRRTVILKQFNDLLKKGNNATMMSLSSVTHTLESNAISSVNMSHYHHRQKMAPVPLQSLHNDPVRFFTAFLTWLHQTIAAEDDLLQEHIFFCLENNNSNSKKHRRNDDTNNIDEYVCDDANTSQENNAEKKKGHHNRQYTRNNLSTTSQSSSSHEESTRKSDVLNRIFDPLAGHFRAHYMDISIAWTEKAEIALKQLDNDVKRQGSQGIPNGSGGSTLTRHSSATNTLGRAIFRSFTSGSQGEIPNNNNNNNNNPGAAAVAAMVICFKLDGMFAFYAETIAKLLSSTTVHTSTTSNSVSITHADHNKAIITSLVSAITDAKWDSTRIFFNLLHTFVSTVMSATAIDMYIRPALTIIAHEWEVKDFRPQHTTSDTTTVVMMDSGNDGSHTVLAPNEDTLTFLSFYHCGNVIPSSSSPSPVRHMSSSSSSPFRLGYNTQTTDTHTPISLTANRPYSIADSLGRYLDCPEHIKHLVKLSKISLESVASGPVPFNQKESEVEPVLGGILDPLAGIVDTNDVSCDTIDDNNNNNNNTKNGDSSLKDEMNPLEKIHYKTNTVSTTPHIIITDADLCKLILRLNIYNRFISDALMEFPFPSRLLNKINGQVTHDVKWYAANVLQSRIYPWLGIDYVMGVLSGKRRDEDSNPTNNNTNNNNNHSNEGKDANVVIDMVRKAERRFTQLTYAIKGLHSPQTALKNTGDNALPTQTNNNNNNTFTLSNTYSSTEHALHKCSILPFLDGLNSSPRIREAILVAVAVRLSKHYNTFYGAVVATKVLGEGNSLKLTPDQMQIILLSDE